MEQQQLRSRLRPLPTVLRLRPVLRAGVLRHGRSAAAPGPVAEPLVDAVVHALRDLGARVQTGVFGADMKVSLVNDGPVTIILEL